MEGTRVGPYLLTGPLGAGGMGVVYAAWDERLERRVAVKRVLPEADAAPQRRERLRREARAAARLSHPSIVQIYDVVETDEADWIVLELVEGPTLAELLRRGPLDLGRLLPLAREIAEGLAEAHGQGILHRDLKAENIVVTRSGHAKILDFGLAKRFWPAAPEASDSLSSGLILGTPRVMSPEQSNGELLDPRSDLFSFGVLLYEAVTGVSPFAAATPVETLHRVCAHQPPPAAELNPAVPLALSELIGELMEKDRERRPSDATQVEARLAALQESRSGSGARASREAFRADLAREPTIEVPPAAARRAWKSWGSWAAGGLVLLLLAAAGLAWALRPRPPLYVAVAEPQAHAQPTPDSGDPETSLAAASLRAALVRDLSGLTRIAVLTPEPGGAAKPQTLARQLAADEVLVPRLDCAGRICRISLSRLQGADGRVLWTETFEAPVDDVSLISAAVGPALRRGYDGFSRRSGAAGPEIGREDWERYVRLDEDYWEHRGGSPSERLLQEVEALRRKNPRFVEVLLLEANLASLRFFDSRDPADAGRTRDLLDEARRLAPGDSRPLWLLATVALSTERLGEAAAAIAELEQQVPGDNRVHVLQALLAERRGRPEEALERMRTAARRRPGQGNLLTLANLESRLGRLDDARRTLATLLARFPNDRNARSFLAQLELGSGSAETAARLYTALARSNPTYGNLSNLGVAWLLLGRYPEASASFRQALALLPGSPAAVLNLADAEWLSGRRTEAAARYQKVIDLAARDPAPTFWQTRTIRAQALAHLGRSNEAVAAVQEALRTAPDNPQVAYEASLVYTLVGDTASAQVNAERALAAGYDRRWFSFPWFAGLDLKR